MQGAPERHAPLYDAYAGRLHVYCWSLVGDDAPNALYDTFVSAARQGPPRGASDSPLWLYRLARTACVRRGALDHAFTRIRDHDPLRHAASGLRADHREVLVLSAGGWLELPEIAQLLGVAGDTLAQLIAAARKRLERSVLDVLLPGHIRPEHEDVIAAFEKGTLDVLLARRAPDRPPAGLRAHVLAACANETGWIPAQAAPTRPLRTVDEAPARRQTGHGAAGRRSTEREPLVIISPRRGDDEFTARRRPARAFVGAVGLAAAAAAAVGVFATLPGASGESPQSGGQNLLVPSSNGGNQPITASAGRSATTPQQTGASPATSSTAPYTAPGTTTTPGTGGVLADPPAGGGPATVTQTPTGHLSTPTLSSASASSPASPPSTPTATPTPTPTPTDPDPSDPPSSTPSSTPQAPPTPVDTPAVEPTPTP